MADFDHIPADARQAAVEGFTRSNPHLNGIDFDTMMEMILDADAHLAVVGDVVVEGDAASALVAHLARLPARTIGWCR